MIRAAGKQRSKTSRDPASQLPRTATRIPWSAMQSAANIRRQDGNPAEPAGCNTDHDIRQLNHGIRPLIHGIHEYNSVHACLVSALVAVSGKVVASPTSRNAMDGSRRCLHDAMAFPV